MRNKGDIAVKRLILYGVRHVELRRNVEYFLDNSYEIVGYSDSYYTTDVLDGKRFISPKMLSHMEFDYIIPLSFKETVLSEMKTDLIGQGIPTEKIVYPVIFLSQGKETMQPDLVRDAKAQYRGEEGLIFGLSYSLRGIFEKRLKPAFYDCSWHGLDLYYNYRMFQYMCREGLLSRVKTALLVFPYYYFDYDMSRSMYHYREGQMFALRGLNDWHNYRKLPGVSDYVVNYQMFGRKRSDFYHFHKYEHQNHGIYQGNAGEADLGGLWQQTHPETVAENKRLLADFFCELAETKITPIFIVPPYFLDGLNDRAVEAARKKKREYYQIIETVGARIVDFFDVFADHRELFADLTHLNSAGAEVFTERINQRVLQERKETDL